ncbi:MAG TPA: type II 3-dehydroquinate dehydratase [bacterium]|nr:type II 3-dehydroquinate dehydratase [bacterium]
MRKILVLHGPNLNLLGEREPNVYGSVTLEEINKELKDLSAKSDVELRIVQSNHEGELVETIQNARHWAEVIIINPAAYTHTSVAIRDALSAVQVPTIEVHLSNIYAREGFRQASHVSPVAVGQISGFGKNSYLLALQAATLLPLPEKKK